MGNNVYVEVNEEKLDQVTKAVSQACGETFSPSLTLRDKIDELDRIVMVFYRAHGWRPAEIDISGPITSRKGEAKFTAHLTPQFVEFLAAHA